ncbi:MAG: hypothetical protein ACI8RZ_002400 [Myxococcota bacterium]|jgi:hypothetical protein
MSTNSFAVIIGVSDYSSYRGDHSDDLPGSVNDARAWLDLALDADGLDMPAENIRLLVVNESGKIPKWAKKFQKKAGDKEAVRRPTAEVIQEAILWLGERLAEVGGDDTDRDSFGPVLKASGLVTFSGHGFALEDLSTAPLASTLFIAPQDVRSSADGPVDAISLGQMNLILQSLGQEIWPLIGVSHGVTWAIDACYTTVKAATPAPLLIEVEKPSLIAAVEAALPEGSSLLEMWQQAVYGRVMLGSEPWGSTYQIPAGSSYHGAFTLALTTLLQQWKPKTHLGVQYIGASYGDLMNRTQAMLDALGVPQKPVLVGLPRLELLAFMRPGNDIAEDQTFPEPNAKRLRGQIDGGTMQGFTMLEIAAVKDGEATRVAVVVQASSDNFAQSVKNQNIIFCAGTETWWRWGIPDDNGTPGLVTGGTIKVTLLGQSESWNDFSALAATELQDITLSNDENSRMTKYSKRTTQVGSWMQVSAGWRPTYNNATQMSALNSNGTPGTVSAPAGLQLGMVWDGSQWFLKFVDWLSLPPINQSTPNTLFFKPLNVAPENTANLSVELTADTGSQPTQTAGWLHCSQRINGDVPDADGISLSFSNTSGAPPLTGAFAPGNQVRYAIAYFKDTTTGRLSAWTNWFTPTNNGCLITATKPAGLNPQSQGLALLRQVKGTLPNNTVAILGTQDLTMFTPWMIPPGTEEETFTFEDNLQALAGPQFIVSQPTPF